MNWRSDIYSPKVAERFRRDLLDDIWKTGLGDKECPSGRASGEEQRPTYDPQTEPLPQTIDDSESDEVYFQSDSEDENNPRTSKAARAALIERGRLAIREQMSNAKGEFDGGKRGDSAHSGEAELMQLDDPIPLAAIMEWPRRRVVKNYTSSEEESSSSESESSEDSDGPPPPPRDGLRDVVVDEMDLLRGRRKRQTQQSEDQVPLLSRQQSQPSSMPRLNRQQSRAAEHNTPDDSDQAATQRQRQLEQDAQLAANMQYRPSPAGVGEVAQLMAGMNIDKLRQQYDERRAERQRAQCEAATAGPSTPGQHARQNESARQEEPYQEPEAQHDFRGLPINRVALDE